MFTPPPPSIAAVSLVVLAFAACPPARADDVVITERTRSLLDPDLYHMPASGAQPATDSQSPPSPAVGVGSTGATERRKRFGRAGSRWWSIGAGAADDFQGDTDINIHGDFSQFLDDELEFGVEVAGWYFNQEGPNTGGVSGSMIFRWHFAHDEEFHWSVFGDLGIGLLGAFDNVPAGGTGFNFLPRAGGGFTHVLDSSEPDGARLTLGVRWHHISNARIEGDGRNPGRDALMLYAEVQFPF